MAANLAKILKQLDKQWKDTEAVEVGEGFTNIPDGNYVVTLEPARVELSKASERLQIAWPMVIAEGKLNGKKLIKFDGLDSELNISWVKGTMNVLGISIPKSATDIPQALEDFFESYKDRKVNISAKTKDEFVNLYINGYAEEPFESDGEPDSEPEDKKSKAKKKESKPDMPSKKEIKAMSRKELKAVIKEAGLDIDPEDYDDTDELKDAIIETLD